MKINPMAQTSDAGKPFCRPRLKEIYPHQICTQVKAVEWVTNGRVPFYKKPNDVCTHAAAHKKPLYRGPASHVRGPPEGLSGAEAGGVVLPLEHGGEGVADRGGGAHGPAAGRAPLGPCLDPSVEPVRLAGGSVKGSRGRKTGAVLGVGLAPKRRPWPPPPPPPPAPPERSTSPAAVRKGFAWHSYSVGAERCPIEGSNHTEV